MLKLYCYPNCSTCKKAQAWLDKHNAAYEYFDIKQAPPSVMQMEAYQQKSGLPLKRFFNTSGMRYREQNLSARLPSMTEREQLELLASDGMLIKRPLLIGESFVLVGFRESEWEMELLK